MFHRKYRQNSPNASDNSDLFVTLSDQARESEKRENQNEVEFLSNAEEVPKKIKTNPPSLEQQLQLYIQQQLLSEENLSDSWGLNTVPTDVLSISSQDINESPEQTHTITANTQLTVQLSVAPVRLETPIATNLSISRFPSWQKRQRQIKEELIDFFRDLVIETHQNKANKKLNIIREVKRTTLITKIEKHLQMKMSDFFSCLDLRTHLQLCQINIDNCMIAYKKLLEEVDPNNCELRYTELKNEIQEIITRTTNGIFETQTTQLVDTSLPDVTNTLSQSQQQPQSNEIPQLSIAPLIVANPIGLVSIDFCRVGERFLRGNNAKNVLIKFFETLIKIGASKRSDVILKLNRSTFGGKIKTYLGKGLSAFFSFTGKGTDLMLVDIKMCASMLAYKKLLKEVAPDNYLYRFIELLNEIQQYPSYEKEIKPVFDVIFPSHEERTLALQLMNAINGQSTQSVPIRAENQTQSGNLQSTFFSNHALTFTPGFFPLQGISGQFLEDAFKTKADSNNSDDQQVHSTQSKRM